LNSGTTVKYNISSLLKKIAWNIYLFISNLLLIFNKLKNININLIWIILWVILIVVDSTQYQFKQTIRTVVNFFQKVILERVAASYNAFILFVQYPTYLYDISRSLSARTSHEWLTDTLCPTTWRASPFWFRSRIVVYSFI